MKERTYSLGEAGTLTAIFIYVILLIFWPKIMLALLVGTVIVLMILAKTKVINVTFEFDKF